MMRKSLSIPFFDSGIQDINLTAGTLHLMQYLVSFPFLAVVHLIHVMPCKVGPHFSVYHIYAAEDLKNVGEALCGGKPIVH